jgi:hypothetical protein
MDFTRYTARHGLKAGAIGGIVGALVLGLLAGITSFVLDQEVFYVTIAQKLGLVMPNVTGWVLHIAVGFVAGSLFIATTAVIQRFALDTRKKSFWVGLLGGIVVWLVIYVPITDLLAPSDLSNLMFAGGSFVFHLVYGVVTALVSLWLIRRTVRNPPVTVDPLAKAWS